MSEQLHSRPWQSVWEVTVKVCGVAVARLQGLNWAPILSTGAW
jgi:hypothetical protein